MIAEILVNVSFLKHTLIKSDSGVVEGDYNTTKLIFNFEEDVSNKRIVFKMSNPQGELIFLKDLVDNEVLLAGRDADGYTCSLFPVYGLYPFELVLYGDDSKLTSATGWLNVSKRQVSVLDNVTTNYLPLFEKLLEELRENALFIRFSSSPNGTDFTEEWQDGQLYMGVAAGFEAPKEASGYKWGHITSVIPNWPIGHGQGLEALVANNISTNQALSRYSTAFGVGTKAGSLGYYYSNIDFINKTITLSDNQTYGSPNTPSDNSYTKWEVGDRLSLTNDYKFDACCVITQLNGNVVTVDALPFASVVTVDSPGLDDYSVLNVDKPDCGMIDFGYDANASGDAAKALNRATFASGREVEALGQYSAVFGRANYGGYATLVAGRNNHGGDLSNGKKMAIGEYSMVAGSGNIVPGFRNVVGGQGNTVYGEFGIIAGQHNTCGGVDLEDNIFYKPGHAAVVGFGNKNYRGASFLAGEGNENRGTRSVLSGYKNYNYGEHSAMFGINNTNRGGQSFVVGNNCANEGTEAWVGGGGVKNYGYRTIAFGHNIENHAQFSSLFGIDHVVGEEIYPAIGETSLIVGCHHTVKRTDGDLSSNLHHMLISGHYNTATAGTGFAIEGGYNTVSQDYCHVGGNYCTASHLGAFVHGYQLTSSNSWQAVFGQYNKSSSEALLVVGNGSSGAPKNALEVLKDGTVKATTFIGTASKSESANSVELRSITNETALKNLILNDVSCPITVSEKAVSDYAGVPEGCIQIGSEGKEILIPYHTRGWLCSSGKSGISTLVLVDNSGVIYSAFGMNTGNPAEFKWLAARKSNQADTATKADTADTATKVTAKAGQTSTYRHIWFSDTTNETARAYSDNITYNPVSDTLKVGNINGKAARAGQADTADSAYSIASTKVETSEEIIALIGQGNNCAVTIGENALNGIQIGPKGKEITFPPYSRGWLTCSASSGINSLILVGQDGVIYSAHGRYKTYATPSTFEWEAARTSNHADTATRATCDASGNNILNTYATKNECVKTVVGSLAVINKNTSYAVGDVPEGKGIDDIIAVAYEGLYAPLHGMKSRNVGDSGTLYMTCHGMMYDETVKSLVAEYAYIEIKINNGKVNIEWKEMAMQSIKSTNENDGFNSYGDTRKIYVYFK